MDNYQHQPNYQHSMSPQKSDLEKTNPSQLEHMNLPANYKSWTKGNQKFTTLGTSYVPLVETGLRKFSNDWMFTSQNEGNLSTLLCSILLSKTSKGNPWLKI